MDTIEKYGWGAANALQRRSRASGTSQEHRAVIKSWEMARHQGHTRRCLSPREWALMVLAEVQAIQEQELVSTSI